MNTAYDYENYRVTQTYIVGLYSNNE